LGLIHSKFYDAFISYAHDDNVLHDDAVQVFQRCLKPRFEAEFRLLASAAGEAEVFMDTCGLPANGDLSAEINEALARTVFLVIFLGRAYPASAWCGKELQLFVDRIAGSRQEALKRTFLIVLDRAVEKKNWGVYLDRPERPIFEKFYDEETGQHIPPMLEDRTGQVVTGPRFLRGVRRIAETMAERAMELRTSLPEMPDGVAR
jgi:hypothetical protein